MTKPDEAPATIRELLDIAGRPVFEQSVGVKTQLVTRALAQERLPTRWYMAVRKFCADHGREPPDHLFDWHQTEPSGDNQNVYSPETCQGQVVK